MCDCEKRCLTRCHWCEVKLACRKCMCTFINTHRLEPKKEPIMTHWADVYDVEYPWSCDTCYEKEKKYYQIIESFEPT
jgi:hypothetical protein